MAAEDHAHEQVALIDEAAERAGSAQELIEIYVALARDGMVTSGYSRGCGIAPLVTEAGPEQSDEIAETARRAFSAMIDRMAFHFVDLGLDRAPARQLADAVIAGVEGALVTVATGLAAGLTKINPLWCLALAAVLGFSVAL